MKRYMLADLQAILLVPMVDAFQYDGAVTLKMTAETIPMKIQKRVVCLLELLGSTLSYSVSTEVTLLLSTCGSIPDSLHLNCVSSSVNA